MGPKSVGFLSLRISGLSLGNPETKCGCGLRGEAQGEPRERERGATTPSIIRKIKKVHQGEQVPRDGRLTLIKDVVMKPLGLKGLFNSIMSVLLLNVVIASKGFLGGHANLNCSLLGLAYWSSKSLLSHPYFGQVWG
jgi:hypothetical protein